MGPVDPGGQRLTFCDVMNPMVLLALHNIHYRTCQEWQKLRFHSLFLSPKVLYNIYYVKLCTFQIAASMKLPAGGLG